MIDLSKLTPAPWNVLVKDDELVVRCESEECDVAQIVWNDRNQHWQPHDAAFIALARNAFDVMMRRKWFASWLTYEQRWIVYEGVPVEVMRWCKGTRFDDPFTALVEADKWYVANVENKP